MPLLAQERSDNSDLLIQPITRHTTSRVSSHSSGPNYSAFLPLVVLSAALMLWLGFQSVQLIGERSNLVATQDSQEASVIAAAQVRSSLDALASSTKKLADQGNSNAKTIVEELAKRGITISGETTTGQK